VALGREHAQRQRWLAVQVYADEAISGASMHGRIGLQRLVHDANHGAFDVILVEHIDRLARNAADTIRLREQVEFIGVEGNPPSPSQDAWLSWSAAICFRPCVVI
jgi:site-specific DNA recombinase